MRGFFSGWIGYGALVLNAVLQEPNDTAYSRRPIVFSGLENGTAFDIGSGTVGPASIFWGMLTVAGLFDAPVGGNLLVTFPLAVPVAVGVGSTYTTGQAGNVFAGLGRSGLTTTAMFSSGTLVGLTLDGRQISASVPVQISGGVLSAQNQSFGSTVSMPVLPSQAPAAGSGQVWNNGGILGVA